MGSGNTVFILLRQGHAESECVRAGWRFELGPSPGPLWPLNPAAFPVFQGCLWFVFVCLWGSLKLRGCFSPCRWPSLMKHYSPTDYVNWLEEYKVRQKAGLEARKIVASFSKRFFSEHVRICWWSSKHLHGSGVCVWVCRHELIQLFLLSPFSVLSQSLPHLDGCKSHCVLFLLSSNVKPFVPASFTFLKPERIGGEGEGEGRRDPQRSDQHCFSLIGLNIYFATSTWLGVLSMIKHYRFHPVIFQKRCQN